MPFHPLPLPLSGLRRRAPSPHSGRRRRRRAPGQVIWRESLGCGRGAGFGRIAGTGGRWRGTRARDPAAAHPGRATLSPPARGQRPSPARRAAGWRLARGADRGWGRPAPGWARQRVVAEGRGGCARMEPLPRGSALALCHRVRPRRSLYI